jgi:hypothetical protein
MTQQSVHGCASWASSSALALRPACPTRVRGSRRRRTARRWCSSGSRTRPSPTATRCCSPASTSSDHAASVPEYPHVLVVDGGTLSAQQVLPGVSVGNPSPAMVEQVVECVAAMAGVASPLPAPDLRPWGASVVHTLTVGVDGWAMHEPLRTGGRRCGARPGRSTTTPTTCPASSTAPSASRSVRGLGDGGRQESASIPTEGDARHSGEGGI